MEGNRGGFNKEDDEWTEVERMKQRRRKENEKKMRDWQKTRGRGKEEAVEEITRRGWIKHEEDAK